MCCICLKPSVYFIIYFNLFFFAFHISVVQHARGEVDDTRWEKVVIWFTDICQRAVTRGSTEVNTLIDTLFNADLPQGNIDVFISPNLCIIISIITFSILVSDRGWA